MKRSLYNVENEKVEFTSMKEVLFVPFTLLKNFLPLQFF